MVKTKMPLSELRKPPRNIRKHGAKQIEKYMRSVEMFGQIRPIIVDETGEIIAGNGLYEAMKGLGKTEADVYIMDGLTDTQKKKLMMADNRIFNLGSDDLSVFEEFVSELRGDFDVPGYDMGLLKAITFTADDVDEQNASYGRISEEDRDALSRTESRYEERMEAAAQHSREIQPTREALEMNYIICPKCGEKIWL